MTTQTNQHSTEPQEAIFQSRVQQLAHDLRTPLSVICMGVEALKTCSPNSEDFAAILAMIDEQGTSPLKEMINDFADDRQP